LNYFFSRSLELYLPFVFVGKSVKISAGRGWNFSSREGFQYHQKLLQYPISFKKQMKILLIYVKTYTIFYLAAKIEWLWFCVIIYMRIYWVSFQYHGLGANSTEIISNLKSFGKILSFSHPTIYFLKVNYVFVFRSANVRVWDFYMLAILNLDVLC
jgi:hypothetical protein